ncbi:MAG: hypothetical protein K6F73_00830 [Lachnospiraceae bacterium]|nr:hypothetical protein [Lachnospiraceae bacterium]
MIIREITMLDDLIAGSNNYYPDRIKFCIHKPTRTVSIDLFYHTDMENELIDETGTDKDIYGGDLMLDPIGVLWEAHPNIARNAEAGTPQNGRELKDADVIDELFEILKYWIR